MQAVKTWDVIIIGGGIIGCSLAIALRKKGLRILIVERGEPGQEASHAAAGMLADFPLELPILLKEIATASARMYPEFVHELQDESGINVDLRDVGTLQLFPPDFHHPILEELPLPAALSDLESSLAINNKQAFFLQERSVDPRALVSAAVRAAKHRQVDIASGTCVVEILIADGKTTGIKTDKTSYQAPIVVNCAGAWTSQIGPLKIPAKPVKGQLFSVVGGPVLRHVVRAPGVYLVPRTDGRLLIGATLENAGFDKRTNPETIQQLRAAALQLVPRLTEARILEAWAGLRPGSPDDLPILGATQIPGYFVATGHYRDGILLAPITAQLMAQLITGESHMHDISAFSPLRFTE